MEVITILKVGNKKDQNRVKDAKEIKTTTQMSEKSAIDSLNDMGDLLK